MKKIVIGMLILLFVFNVTAYANKFAEYDEVTLIDSYDNSEGNYKTVNIRIDGQDILSDVPAIIYPGNRTLVPISFITGKIGAETIWNPDDRSVTIIFGSKKIVLTIDSKIAYVNGEAYTLPDDVAAKLMSFEGMGRTMVPARFVSEQLGYDIAWDGTTRTVSINKPKQEITDVRYDNSGNYPEIRFKVTGLVSMTSLSVDGASVGGSNALILEFHNTELNLKEALVYDRVIINDSIEKVYDITFESTSGTPPGVKAVVDMGYFRHGEVSYDKTTGEMVVELINTVNYVDVETINQSTAVVIDTAELPAYNRTYDAASNSVIIDVIHSILTEDDATIEVNKGGIKSVSSVQNDDSSEYDLGTRFSRVTIKLDDHLNEENVFVEGIGSKVYVYVQEAMFGTYAYSRNLEKGTSAFSLNLTTPNAYSVVYDQYINKISFSVPKSNTTLTAGTERKDDGVINAITIKDNLTTDQYDIEITLAKGTTYKTALTNNSSYQVSFTSEVLQQSEFKEKLIVIDAGHGGHDPGASYNGLKEKDINLKTSLVLKRKLENLGFKVYMTRERDNYVQLYNRASIANQLNADLFVSVHVNAARSTSARGLETLYAPDNARDNYDFAKVVQEQMIQATGGYNRGVVSRPELVVIRETNMDAVLVEIGFLSNTGDYAKLLTDAYIETVADGIVNGIVKYME